MLVDRKQSTPMMPAFIVSAPGKVIVFGEHAVVHGKVYQIVHSLLH
jgi:mevalonate kinase